MVSGRMACRPSPIMEIKLCITILAMRPIQPYQPLLLRLLHGVTALCLMLSILTAFWTYNTYDGRWGTIPLPQFKEIEGIHGTFGLYTLLIFPVFVRYAFGPGHRRLAQGDTLQKLQQVGQPIWWYTLNRLTNTLTLVALLFALFSGKMMDETWLPKGDLEHFWYYGHLISWVVMVGAIALHLLINAKVGGVPLLLSMWTKKFRAKDSPRQWPEQVGAWWVAVRSRRWSERLSVFGRLSGLEWVMWLGWGAAWGISLVKESLG